jgi:hypothetical protein
LVLNWQLKPHVPIDCGEDAEGMTGNSAQSVQLGCHLKNGGKDGYSNSDTILYVVLDIKRRYFDSLERVLYPRARSHVQIPKNRNIAYKRTVRTNFL